MNDGLSLSIFTIEVDHRPLIAFRCKTHSEADAICLDERVRAKLSSMSSGGKPLINDFAILRVRLARPNERAMYREHAASRSNESGLLITYLVDLDGPAPE